MRMEADVGRKHLQAKELRMLGCDQKLGGGTEQMSPQSLQKEPALPTT